jgi:hypothetical protein
LGFPGVHPGFSHLYKKGFQYPGPRRRWLSSNTPQFFNTNQRSVGQKNQRAVRWALWVEALIFLDFLILFGQAKRIKNKIKQFFDNIQKDQTGRGVEITTPQVNTLV